VYGISHTTGWTWYTGSASWLYRLGVEYILGLKLHGDHFTIEPCIPSRWPGYSMVYRRGDTSYRIIVENSAGASSQIRAVELDGALLPDFKVSLVDDRQQHEVRVQMGISQDSPDVHEAQAPEESGTA